MTAKVLALVALIAAAVVDVQPVTLEGVAQAVFIHYWHDSSCTY